MPIDLSLTIPNLFLRAVAEHGGESALLTKREGAFVATTWNELAREVAIVSGVLRRHALPSDRLVQISENRREWVILDLACHFAGVVHVPLHASLSGPQLVEQIVHCQPRCIFVSSAEQWQKIEPHLQKCGDDLPRHQWMCCHGGIEGLAGHLHCWSKDVFDPRTTHTEVPPLEAESAAPDDVATILYTSGTTGEPKGVMLTQRNLSSNAQAMVETFGPSDHELRLNILPLSHIFARTCDLYAWLVRGSTLALAESRETVIEDLKAVRPTTINGVPYFYERLRKILCERGLENQPGALQGLLGGRIRSCCSGGAALPPGTIEFFAAQNVPLLQGYGLTESSPVITMSTREHNRPGTAGRVIPGIELRIADDGEVLTRGGHVMQGYYKNPQATAEVIHDGWLHTGDLGTIDADGYLHIIGRKKEMIVLSTGKKVAPSAIESRLAHDPLVAQVLVVGEGRSHLAALVVPQPEALKGEIAARGIALRSREEALVNLQVLDIYLQRFAELLADLSPQEQVHHVALLPRAFSIEQGEMTAKLSLRRDAICRNFAAEIQRMYGRSAC